MLWVRTCFIICHSSSSSSSSTTTTTKGPMPGAVLVIRRHFCFSKAAWYSSCILMHHTILLYCPSILYMAALCCLSLLHDFCLSLFRLCLCLSLSPFFTNVPIMTDKSVRRDINLQSKP